MSTYRKKFSDEIRGGCRGHVDFKWESIKNDKDREHYLGQSLHNNPQWWGERFTKKSLEAERYREKHSTQIRQAELESVKAREQQLMDEALGLRPKSTARPYNPRGLSKYDIMEVTRPGAIAEGEGSAGLSGGGMSGGGIQGSNPDRVPGIGYGELWRPGRNRVAPTRLEEEKESGEKGGVVKSEKRASEKSLDETLKSEFVKVDQGIKNYENDYGISNGWSDDDDDVEGGGEGEWNEAPKKIDLKNVSEVLGKSGVENNSSLKRKRVDEKEKVDCLDGSNEEPTKKDRKRSHSRHHSHHHHHHHRSHSHHKHRSRSRSKSKSRSKSRSHDKDKSDRNEKKRERSSSSHHHHKHHRD